MPGHTKTIYSRRQRMAPGQYETPLADFLDRLPDYFNQYQQNQLAIDRQKLAEKRYDDAIKQQNFRNEISMANTLEGSAQYKFLKSSNDPRLQKLGSDQMKSEDTFNSLIDPLDMSEDAVDKVDYYKGLLKNPTISGNASREKQVNQKIKEIQENSLKDVINTIVSDNKTDPTYKIIGQKSLTDPQGAYEDILNYQSKIVKGERKTDTGGDGILRYIDTGEPVFEGIKAVPTPSAQVEGLQSLLSSKQSMFLLNPNDLGLKEDIEEIQERLKELTGVGTEVKIDY